MAKTVPTEGLLICGKVIGRRRRTVSMKDGKLRYVITVRVMADGEVYSCDRWSDVQSPSDIPAMGDVLTMPIRLKTFSTKGGAAKTSLEWGPAQDSQEF